MSPRKIPSRPASTPRLLPALPLLAFAALPAWAQSLPDAGRTLQELQRPDALPRAAHPAPTLTRPAEGQGQTTDGTRFFVREVRLQGGGHIDIAGMQAELQALAGREQSLADLQREAARQTGKLRDAGYALARVVVPAQEIKNGVVRFQLLEGNLAQTRPDNRSIVGTPRIDTVIAAQLEKDSPLTELALERMLLIAADLPGTGAVTGTLAPGDRVGSSDLTVSVAPGKAIEGEISADNAGNRYTGENRINAGLDINSPSGTGDRLRLNATATDEALYYGRLAYDLPIGGDGLRVGAALSHSQYELGREFSNLRAHGTANTASLYANWPLIRYRTRNVWLGALYDHRRLTDRIDTAATDTGKSADVVTLSLEGDWQDDFGGAGATKLRIAPTLGRLSIDSPSARAQDASGPRTSGSYSKWQASVARLQALGTPDTRLFASLQAQWAGKNLDSSEKFVLGGAYGVRAYPQGEGVGDEGTLLNLELRRDVAPQLEAKLFYDWGRVRINKNDYTTAANTATLSGTGVGLSWTPGDFVLSASLAWRNRQAPMSAPDRSPRAWVQAGWRF